MLFERSEMEERAAKARALMAEAGVDMIVADSGEFLAWLTGYTVSETMYRAAFLPREGAPFFVLRALDADNCREAVWFEDIVGYPDTASPHAIMAEAIEARGFGSARIGIDANSYGYSTLTAERLRTLLPRATFVDLGEFGHRLRDRKSKAEIALLSQAAAIADKAMAAIRDSACVGMTTRDAAATAAAIFLREGADTGEVGPIVKSSGPHAFLHGPFSGERLGEGDVLHVELIPKVANYSARLMRPIVIGGRPTERQSRVAERLIALQGEQIAAMKAGVRACDVDAIVREGVLAEGLRTEYPNVTAYTLGLVTRTPRTSDFSRAFLPTAQWHLEEGMVFHVYTSAEGLAFSETVVVTQSGGRRLTNARRALLTQ
ncbi:M24 family metallopeptidase [Consotaella aegiceratis]|uniref:M24 family metallopeptidase n=1 Tax=Consotaella aegiceratis TaxID=3097961 RepID=UPI002F41C61F